MESFHCPVSVSIYCPTRTHGPCAFVTGICVCACGRACGHLCAGVQAPACPSAHFLQIVPVFVRVLCACACVCARECVCARVCARLRPSVRPCVRPPVRARLRACVRACVRVAQPGPALSSVELLQMLASKLLDF